MSTKSGSTKSGSTKSGSATAAEASASPARPAQPADARRQNTAALLQTVLRHSRISRGEIATTLGLSQGTVSKIVAPIVSGGLLRELPSQYTGGGRPRVPLDLDASARLAIGLHLGSRRTTVGVVDLRGRGRAVTMENRSPDNPAEVLARAATMISNLLGPDLRERLLGVGVTASGWVDHATGVVGQSDSLGWQHIPVRQPLEDVLGVPILVDSTVRALASAELLFGRARRRDCTVHLSVGSSVDAAIVVGDSVLTGLRSAAGRVAHLPVTDNGVSCGCGRQGCLRLVATDNVVLDAARRAGVIGLADGLGELVTAASRGDTAADGLLVDRARYLGRAVAHLVDLVDPELVVMSGGILARRKDLSVLRVELATVQPGWDVDRVVASALGKNASVSSSASVVLGAYFGDPLAFEDF